MATRRIFVHPGEIIEVRLVHHLYDKTLSGWRDQTYPKSVAYRFDYDVVAPTDPQIRLGHFINDFEPFDHNGQPK